jgi:hypothetical protein
MSAEFVEGWIRRNAAERPNNVVPSALERLAFMHATEERELGTEWARLTEKDASHLGGLLDIVMTTGDLEVRSTEAVPSHIDDELGVRARGQKKTCMKVCIMSETAGLARFQAAFARQICPERQPRQYLDVGSGIKSAMARKPSNAFA